MVKSPISGRFYARLILEKRALAKVLFLYFGLRNYSLIKKIIEPFFLNKFCLPHSQSLKLGNSDNIQRHKVSLGQSLQFFPVNFSIMRFTQFLISELNWEQNIQKPIFHVFTLPHLPTDALGELSSAEINQIYNTQGKRTVEKVYLWQKICQVEMLVAMVLP